MCQVSVRERKIESIDCSDIDGRQGAVFLIDSLDYLW